MSGIHMAQDALYYGDEHKRYAKNFEELGLGAPTNQKYYTVYITPDLYRAPKGGPVTPLPDNIKPFVEKDRFLAVAVGNIDWDKTADVWTISEKDGVCEPKNIVNDMKE